MIAKTDYEKLNLIADLYDARFPNDPFPQIQTDLRMIANRIRELEAIVEKLPLMADGKTRVYPGMRYWFEYTDEPGYFGDGIASKIETDDFDSDFSRCWPTREAAEASLNPDTQVPDAPQP